MFFSNLEQYGNNVAIITEKCEITTYLQLSKKVEEANTISIGFKALVFIKAKNTIETITSYLSNLNVGNAIYLYDTNDDAVIKNLIKIYKPNALISEGKYTLLHTDNLNIHSETCLLLSTSGSTGTPKFVRLTENNINSNADSIAEYLSLTSEDRALAHLKFHYSFGLSILNSHLAVGASVVLTDVSVLDDEFGNLINKYKATNFSGVPFVFESLDKRSFDLGKYPSIRQITQAGGKLYKEDVLKWHNKCVERDIEFYVMYGQTEASPRISYLPPELISKCPDAIGVAIPGGEICIVDENRKLVVDAGVEGELVYKGPNVMQGYASQLTDLSLGSLTSELFTGDIAKFDKNGVYSIVGRSSRFIKLFGIRINLDDIQTLLNEFEADIICTGDDENIVFATIGNAELKNAITYISKKINLPEVCFVTVSLKEMPLLLNGKIDYKYILTIANKRQNVFFKLAKMLFSRKFVKEFFAEAFIVAGIVKQNLTINSIFSRAFDGVLLESDSFKDLGGDSMSYVIVSLELEQLLGYIPDNWELLSISQLIKLQNSVSAL
jgi:long-chain acyl-CoA synthetase